METRSTVQGGGEAEFQAHVSARAASAGFFLKGTKVLAGFERVTTTLSNAVTIFCSEKKYIQTDVCNLPCDEQDVVCVSFTQKKNKPTAGLEVELVLLEYLQSLSPASPLPACSSSVCCCTWLGSGWGCRAPPGPSAPAAQHV